MKRADLAKFLRQLADDVESGDSAEGRLCYQLSDRGPDVVDVDICVRTGNRDGQGGYISLNEMPGEV